MWPKKTIYQQPLDVNQWRQKVADATQPPKPLKVQLDSLSPRQLRSTARAERSGLRSISGNRQKLPPSAPFVKSNPTLKRKRGMSTQRGPGRPPGRGRGGLGRGTGSSRGRGKGHAGNLEEPQQHEEQEQEEQDNSDGSDFAPPGTKKVPLKNADDPQPSTAPSAKSRSRSRPRKDFDFDQQISVSQVTLKYLASCSPSVTVRKIDQVRRDFPAEVCQPTITLYNKIANVPSNLIPVSLKCLYDQQVDTPRKSRDAPPGHQYTSPTEQFYPQTLLLHIMKKVDTVRKDADWNEEYEADEDQWSLIVHLLLAEVESWPRAQSTKVLKTSRCIISPPAIYTKMPGGCPLEYDVDTASKISEAPSDAPSDVTSVRNPDRKLSKMVDYSLGLEVDYKDDDKVSKAFSYCHDYEHSLNQTMSFMRRVPLFGDLELKKKLQTRDPGVQLAIWKSAWLLKAQHHGWDTTLPMPGITVIGHEWSFYLFMAAGDGLIMLGPYSMGSTATVNGVWTILCRLNILFGWGTTTYRKWFHDNIMSWVENTKAGDLKNLSLSGTEKNIDSNENGH